MVFLPSQHIGFLLFNVRRNVPLIINLQLIHRLTAFFSHSCFAGRVSVHLQNKYKIVRISNNKLLQGKSANLRASSQSAPLPLPGK